MNTLDDFCVAELCDLIQQAFYEGDNAYAESLCRELAERLRLTSI